MSLLNGIIISIITLWCYLGHPRVIRHFVLRNNRLPRPALPVSSSDKFLWRKLIDHNPLFTMACDKLASKAWAVARCPQLKAAKVLWAGTDPQTIPLGFLRQRVIIKASHGSGMNILDPRSVSEQEIRSRATRWLGKRHAKRKGEWGYKNVRRKIFVEEALLDGDNLVATEYKFHVCCGTTAYVFVKITKAGNRKDFMILDKDGQVSGSHSVATAKEIDFLLPPNYRDMRSIAERLAEPFDFLRTDLYNINGEIYLSELTVYPSSGYGNIGVPELVNLRERLWDIRTSRFLSSPQKGIWKAYACILRQWLDERESKAEKGEFYPRL